MATMKIKFTKDSGEYKNGDTVELPRHIAKQHIRDGNATSVKAEEPKPSKVTKKKVTKKKETAKAAVPPDLEQAVDG